jgi:hypothetical protein
LQDFRRLKSMVVHHPSEIASMFRHPSARPSFKPKVEVLEGRLPLSAAGGAAHHPPRQAAAQAAQVQTDLTGIWINHANGGECEIVQVGTHGRARFINEYGARAWGTVRGDRVFIPDWYSATTEGLVGRVRGGRIVWPGGNYWHRVAS